MPRPNRFYSILAVTALLSALGCESSEPPSALIGGYIFSRDLELERRVLHIEESSEFGAECMWTDLPAGNDAPWREVDLDEKIHRALIRLLVDETLKQLYEADTAKSMVAETFICTQELNGDEFCYVPQMSVTGVSPPWRFALQADVELSPESEELVEQFLLAHEACWNGGTLMTGGSSGQ